MINRNIFVILVILITLVSCDQNRVFDQYKSLSNGWHKDTLASFILPQLDSTQQYNLFINVRNSNEYEFNNLYVIAQMDFPQGKTIVDTLQYEMAKPSGEWLGEGFSDIKENKLWYKENVPFNEEGTYKVTIQHAMRKNGETDGVEMLNGVTEVGFRIEHAQQP